jgi:uncharacterized membrane protein YhhN
LGCFILSNNNGLTPTPKVATSALVGAVVVILSWVLTAIFKIDPPVELGSVVTAVLMCVAAYFKKDKPL